MPRCVVIQPFDNGEFDHRYDDVLVPAIEAAKLEPYRVDRDPSAVVPIDTIEDNIRNADICLADISDKNPNVWYEVGYALASGKEVVLICKEGSEFPFDVRHRSIIRYTTGSKRNLAKLEADISAQLQVRVQKTKLIANISPIKRVQGLSSPEMLALALLMESTLLPYGGMTPSSLADDMEKGGVTRFATTLAIEGLLQKTYIERCDTQDYNDTVNIYRITKSGIKWCLENQSKFTQRITPPAPQSGTGYKPPKRQPAPVDDSAEEDDIPF
jgi:nucleoside 2-deoxyribosyltransferase